MNKLLSTALLAAILSTSGFAAGSDPIATDPIEIESGAKLVIENQDGNINDTLLDKSVLVKAGGTGIIDGSFSIANEVITLAFEGNATYSFENGGSDTVINKGTIKLGVPVVSDIVSKSGTGTEGDPIKVAFTSGKSSSDLGKIDQNYDSDSSKVTGKIEVSGVDTLTYNAASTAGYALEEDNTIYDQDNRELTARVIASTLIFGNTSGSAAKKLSQTDGNNTPASFTVLGVNDGKYYSIPVDTIPTVYYNTGEPATDTTLADSLAKASDYEGVKDKLSKMGINVYSKGTTSSAIGYIAGQSGTIAISALETIDYDTFVNISDNTIDIDKSKNTNVVIATNLHNLKTVTATKADTGSITGVTGFKYANGPTFSGTTNYLVLTGNNTYLNDATFDCPVKYTSATAMMTGGTYTKALVIEDDVTIGGNTTIDASKLELASGKKITVNEGATLTLKLGQDE